MSGPAAAAASRRRAAGTILLYGGVAFAVFALEIDLLGLGEVKFEWRQAVACLFGLAMAGLGFWLLPADAPPRAGARRVWAASAALSVSGALALAAWFGLFTGCVEVAHEWIRPHVVPVTLPRPASALWLTPLCYVVLLAPLGLALGLLARRWPRLVVEHVAVFVLTGVLAWTQLALYGAIDRGTATFLAAAIGIQVARASLGHSAAFARLRRRSGVALAALVAVLAAATAWWPVHRERSSMAALVPPRPASANVLLIVLDTIRADRMSLHGYDKPTTPRLDALAARGVAFERMAATCSWTLPAHATVLTGLYGFEHGADHVAPLDDTPPTLAEVLQQRGYATGGFVGNLGYCSSRWGLDRGCLRYFDYPVDARTSLFVTSLGRNLFEDINVFDKVRNDAPTVAERFLDWVAELERDRPFFAFLNLYDAHSLYLPPPPYDRGFGEVSPRLRDWFVRKWNAQEMQGFANAYDGCIAFMDEHIGRILERLAALGRLEQTLVVVTGDHGELFGEHGLREHGNCLYIELLHVPCVFVLPGRVPAGRRVAEWVSLRDVPATVLDLLGADARLPGTSLAGFWSERGPAGAARQVASPVLSEVSRGVRPMPGNPVYKGDMKSLIVDGLHLILNGDGVLELYDLAADPGEARDLTATSAGAARAQELLQRLRQVAGGKP